MTEMQNCLAVVMPADSYCKHVPLLLYEVPYSLITHHSFLCAVSLYEVSHLLLFLNCSLLCMCSSKYFSLWLGSPEVDPMDSRHNRGSRHNEGGMTKKENYVRLESWAVCLHLHPWNHCTYKLIAAIVSVGFVHCLCTYYICIILYLFDETCRNLTYQWSFLNCIPHVKLTFITVVGLSTVIFSHNTEF